MGIRVFTAIVNTTGPAPNDFRDWPAKMQDAVYAAMEAKSQQLQIPLALTDVEVDSTPEDGWFVRIHLSEIVVSDAERIDPNARIH